MFELQIADRREGGGTKWQTIKCEKFATKKGIMSLKWPANVFVENRQQIFKIRMKMFHFPLQENNENDQEKLFFFWTKCKSL